MFYDTSHAEQMFYRQEPHTGRSFEMAMQPIVPVQAAVTAHWRTGAPQAISFAGVTSKVTRVLALRREQGTFSAATGPRTLWELETEDAALVLSFAKRTRTWRIEAFDDAWATLPFASTVEVPGGVLSHA